MAEATAAAAREGRRIVVAVDEGEESIHALQWLLQNFLPPPSPAVDAATTIILLYARPPPPVFSPLDGTETARERHGFGTNTDFVPNLEVTGSIVPGYLFSEEVLTSMDRYSRDLAGTVTAKAERICKEYTNVKVEVKVSSGDARDVICDMAEKLGADLLVMGSHGYGFIKRALLGSVSDYCARNAKCPVLIVKRPVP